jgi:hypothetical protein
MICVAAHDAGGSKRLYRKVADRSSTFYPDHNNVSECSHRFSRATPQQLPNKWRWAGRRGAEGNPLR